MKKRIIAVLMCALMVVSLAAGCGKKGGAGSNGNVTLKWAIWDESSTQYWGDIKKAYEEAHKGVTIEMVDLGSTDYMTVLATELSGSGSEFDVVTIKDVPGYATLVQKNAIIALDDYIKKDKVDLKKFAGATDQVVVNGKLYVTDTFYMDSVYLLENGELEPVAELGSDFSYVASLESYKFEVELFVPPRII